MLFRFSTLAAAAALLSASTAHMTMSTPPQWAVPGEPQAPLAADGSDFPCANGTPDQVASVTYTPGGSAQLIVVGSAVHGGGSGQMVITYDFPPTSNSVWRVMQTFEGDHPVRRPDDTLGNFTPNPLMTHDPIPWTVPDNLPAGKAAVAWTWFNKSGNREMYMKCATVKIDGAAYTSGDLNQAPGMLALPTMFRANSGNGCAVVEGIDAIAFKNPGPRVLKKGGYTSVAVGCDSSLPGTDTGAPDISSSTPVTQPAESTSIVAEPTSIVAGPTSIAAEPTSAVAEPTSAVDLPTSVVDLPTAYPTQTDILAATQKNKSATTLTPPTVEAPPPTVEAPANGTPCPEGKFYCNADNTWSQCGSGVIQNMGTIPAGMQCTDGTFAAKAIKRAIRFSHEHMQHRSHY